ncbi:MAG: D-2-hydroxyacid dehydrogenase [Proteobacteria bacterium]|nr:D-2-hydroxyacid dehydrogenase [Pseudomonadota bacterium]
MPAPFALPFHPRHVVIGAGAHVALAAYIRERRPDLEIRGAKHTDVSADDLAWADTYVGFKRPPAGATMGSVRWVHCTGAGVDSWLSPVELDRAILLTRTPESFGPAIAEWAVARLFAFEQQLLSVAAAQREHRWSPRDISPVAGTRALVVGTGDVGRAIARAFSALGITVDGVSRSGAPQPGFRAVHPVSALADVVGDAQWIVLVIPDTPATRGLFSRDVLSRCRGAVLLNAGRGATLDERALPEALDKEWLRGAALDVFETEPLPATSPLWDDARVMISPHISGLTTIPGAGDGFLECVAALEQGRLPRWAVDRDRGY